MNFCRGLVSAVLEELFECIKDVHREREIELEYQTEKNREVRPRHGRSPPLRRHLTY
jgi:hypothetical protein